MDNIPSGTFFLDSAHRYNAQGHVLSLKLVFALVWRERIKSQLLMLHYVHTGCARGNDGKLVTVDIDMFGGNSLPGAPSAAKSSTSRTPVIDILASLRAALLNEVWRQTHNTISRWQQTVNMLWYNYYRQAATMHAYNTTTHNKSPAVARVSRPYSWCTLATCVHNCPSMMLLPAPEM